MDNKERLHILEAVKWAQEHPQQIMYMSNESENKEEFMAELMNQYGFDEVQAIVIIDIRARAFTKKEKEKVNNEIQEILGKINN